MPSGSGARQRAASSASRPPSSASLRPSSSASLRPPSSVSLQPSSSASLRTQSSLSQRPPSSASTRAISRVSHRPVSRYARPASRHASARLLPLYQALVTQVTGITNEDEEAFQDACENVSKSIEQMKGGPGLDMNAIDKQINGHVEKLRIKSLDDIAEALQHAFTKLKTHLAKQESEHDVDQEIKMYHLPDHIQFLTLLSGAPTSSTNTFASEYLDRVRNPPPPPPTLTWTDILAEEPFEGQHWEGAYGLPAGSIKNHGDADNESHGSTPSLSPLDDSDDFDDTLSSVEPDEPPSKDVPSSPKPAFDLDKGREDRNFAYRYVFEELKGRQYWRDDWRSGINSTRPFNLGDPSTLGPSFLRALGDQTTQMLDLPENEKYIYEHDAVREVLMALQGRANLLLCRSDGTQNPTLFVPSEKAPRLVHLTQGSQESILTSFAGTATAVECLRTFVSTVFRQAAQHLPVSQAQLWSSRCRYTRTLEAFTDATCDEIWALEKWLAGEEEAICLAQAGVGDTRVVSLLSLEKKVRDTFAATFDTLLAIQQDIVRKVGTEGDEGNVEVIESILRSGRFTPVGLTALLLNSVLKAVQTRASMDDSVTVMSLMRVFLRTAEPMWEMVGQWLHNGMPVETDDELDKEFFIQRNGLGLIDPDFWREGYSLREGAGQAQSHGAVPKTVPEILADSVDLILSTGKAKGLLRILGCPDEIQQDTLNSKQWRPLADILPRSLVSGGSAISLSMETLSRIIFDELQTPCDTVNTRLVDMMVTECQLLRHLNAIEDLYFMRRGDTASHFADILFLKMDSTQNWTDFHFLNSAFADVLAADGSKFVEPSLVRLSYRGSRAKLDRTVKALQGLLMEYAIPFPLTYIFGPEVLQTYCSIFVFLLQIRRAKAILERILLKGTVAPVSGLAQDMKAFYAMRSKLSWFVNVLLNFLTGQVIHMGTIAFHNVFSKTKSLDEMIHMHDVHIQKIQRHCLLQPKTSALHRAILSVLDMCLHFSDYFIAFAGEAATHDISRQSIKVRHHRSRRQRLQRKNVIGFSHTLQETLDSSSDEEDEGAGPESDAYEPSFSLGASNMTSADEGFFTRLDKMSTELDELVRFIRHGVENLAGEAGDSGQAFSILAFTLEDWDT